MTVFSSKNSLKILTGAIILKNQFNFFLIVKFLLKAEFWY